MNNDKLAAIAADMRRDVFKMAYRAGGAHLGACFSCLDILTTLYFADILKYDPKQPCSPDRDRFVLSKGHASASLYAVLSRAKFFSRSTLWKYCQPDSILGGHPNMLAVPGIEASTGALGHGFPFATGHALAAKLDGKDYRTYVLLGDGECQEGTVWETAMFAPSQRLDNLTIIIDANGLQAMEKISDIMPMEPLADKFRAFGWHVLEIDGHNFTELQESLSSDNIVEGKPKAIIARTVKGKGISFMEGIPIWHFRMPDAEELPVALQELGLTMEELKADA